MISFKRNLATAAQNGSSSSGRIAAGLILSRTPIVTPEINQLESQYYEYQNQLRRRLMWTFPYYFYYKKGTVAERRFISAQRGPINRQPGVWYPKGVPDIKHNRERSKKQEIVLPRENSENSQSGDDLSRPIAPNSRVTQADEKGDLSSLERQLARTLYLLVENGKGEWKFPSFEVENDDIPLHISAEEGLKGLGGQELLTWSVSNTPAGVLQNSDGKHEFLMKSHILAGKFELQQKKNFQRFAWLTKDEVKKHVDDKYFAETGFLLADI
ncbi:hypothetical protein ZYGR_0U03250 [Zygosaccharomyces rouxii]|uniref:Large ribosomal subunit protein mL46 n=2 Tax=Zygosaccharomyces rouxii TaxID=4956 RepID=C5DYV6_ZYGRC|nr:mitochondrial 54S ribosomal protein YmL17/YmL30 [Zygosaccharomyces rouxii]KAH9201320.1 mitochondrial 54S ribosomal protein YmL17/YmL30 [Zygosaccharomyces rouxii]GAV50469.1 hypothetical protein ZYGR_0U03250 [Zygosaccharomyces rouxii]CAQ43404.1 54S ribosomal protein L17 [Zygosaccharomyces rouxii]CAR28967.1 ZYRO0F16082p [Zygosaccharomyces rouxii]